MKLFEILQEAPITGYETIGDFSKSSSFRKEGDRRLITTDKHINKLKTKFENTDYDFNMFFVNSSKANKHTEVGEVSLDWVAKNLGDDVATAVEKTLGNDAVTMIFTNNKGSQGVPMTPWIIAHRIGHALRRKSGGSSYHYTDASTTLIRGLNEILDDFYGVSNFASSDARIWDDRGNQLLMKNFFQHVCTFKSARDKKIRDWFEVLNEMIAQYLTTSKGIQFNPAPKTMRAGDRTYSLKPNVDMEDVQWQLDNLAETMNYTIDSLIGASLNSIYVM